MARYRAGGKASQLAQHSARTDGDGNQRRHFKNDREPFALTVFGATIYVVLTAGDVATVFKRTEALTFDRYVNDIMVQIGLTPEAIAKMWQHQPSGARKGPMVPNPGRKPLVHLSEAIFKHQLHPGPQLDELQDVLLGRMHEVMSWEAMTLSSRVVLGHQQQNGRRRVSLLEWIKFAMLEGATRAFFGGALLDKVDGGLLDDFAAFDDQSWKLVYRLPPPWSTAMGRSLRRVRASFTRYFEMPMEQRGDACWMVRALESEMAAAGIAPPDIAANLFLLYWVINGNAWKLAFWVVAHLAHRPALLQTVQGEVRVALAAAASTADLAARLEGCPATVAVYHEALRLAASSMGVRDVVAPVVLSGGRQLRAGARLLIPFRQMLTDATVWDEQNDDSDDDEADSFDAERFLRSPELSDAKRNPSFRPFGGGATLCPGRFLAKREVLTCVAQAVGRFELALADPLAPFPRVEGRMPCLGVMKPVDGDDVTLLVVPRSE
ncbi:cytochrome p450 [Diplodia corticola]|uniref:Cytochrome p450 n=1 Tax=Diplodia corticola TaxID=236234 RepID=A0A1J9RP79_9PEZI|nr:cytochrome p450 [Diplodia corticola]OJD29373.1 cytochrome p450 [Diplodia corticola]